MQESLTHHQLESAIGLDIEQINLMPKTADYREDYFYTSNFKGR